MKSLRLYARVFAHLGPERSLAGLLTLANVALAIATFAEPILFGRIIDALTAAGDASAAARAQRFGSMGLTGLVLAWGAFGIFTIAAGVFTALHADRIAHRRRLVVLAESFDHALRLPPSFHENEHSGRVLKVMFDGAQAMWHLWLSFFRTSCASVVTVFVLLPLALFLNFWMGLLLLGLVATFGVLTAFVVRRTESLQHTVEQFHTELAEQVADALGNLPVVQSFTRVEAEVRGLEGTIRRLLAAQIPVLSWWAVVSVATRAASTITVLCVFLVGAYLRAHGRISVGEIVTFTSFSTLLIRRLDEVVSFSSFLFAQAPKIGQLFDFIDAVPAIADSPRARDLGRARGAVRFEDVSFAYDGERPAVQDLSFEVEPGEVIALVGTTGSGKSTTLGLLHRAFDPQSGRVLVDGVDVRDVSLSSLRRNIGVVFQEPMLFARTIRENVRIGDPEAGEGELLAALSRAQAADIAARHAGGLDSIVGERGRSLSGGERQRLAIARAILKDPPILVLDEATSALDAATEARVKRALDEVMKGRTTFVIAHRLSTIRNASRVLVFERGRIVESGTFDDLVARGGRLAELARAQFMLPQSDEPRAPAAEPVRRGTFQNIVPSST